MVIWFNVKEAREQLLKYGFVYSLRPKMRRCGRDMLSYNGFGKKGMVYIIFVKEIEFLEELQDYFIDSGFENPLLWWRNSYYSNYLFLVILEKT